MKRSIISVFAKYKITTGAHKRCIGLLKELSERGYDINLFSPVNFLEQSNKYFKISEHRESIVPKSIQTFLSVRRRFKYAREHLSAANVVLVFGYGHIFASLYLKKKLNIPLIFAVRSDLYKSRKIRLSHSERFKSSILNKLMIVGYLSVFSMIERYVYKKSDKIIVQNEGEYEMLAQRYSLNKNKMKVIGNNINFRKPESPVYTNSSSALRSIIFVGSFTERKGIKLLLRAVKILVDEDFKIELDILGEGPLRAEMQEFIQLNNLKNFVNMHGFVDNPLKYIANSDMMVMPSLYDSFPNTVLEALYVGTPVIGSDVGGIIEILKYETLLFEPGSAFSIAKKIKSLYNTDTYKKYRKLCEERRKAFIFDWVGKFEKELLEIV